jgi:hypothetical protein
MGEKKSYRISQNLDRIVNDLSRAEKVLKYLESITNSIDLDLILDDQCRRLTEGKGIAFGKELAGAIFSIQLAQGITDNKLRYALNDSEKFDKYRLQALGKLEDYRQYVANLRDDNDAVADIMTSCNPKDAALNCTEITGLLDEAGTVVSYVDESTIGSDWFKAMAIFEYYEDYYALVILKERAYIFCDVPERVTNEIIPRLKSERDFESFYHRELKEHTCDCN